MRREQILKRNKHQGPAKGQSPARQAEAKEAQAKGQPPQVPRTKQTKPRAGPSQKPKPSPKSRGQRPRPSPTATSPLFQPELKAKARTLAKGRRPKPKLMPEPWSQAQAKRAKGGQVFKPRPKPCRTTPSQGPAAQAQHPNQSQGHFLAKHMVKGQPDAKAKPQPGPSPNSQNQAQA